MSPVCPVCSGGGRQFWERVWGKPGKTVYACTQCESFFLWPPNSPQEQAAFDRDYANYIAERARAVGSFVATDFANMVDDSIDIRLADIGEMFTGVRSLLEIGAETGGFLDRLRQHVGRVVAVDAAPEYVEILRRKGYAAYRYLEDVPLDQRFERICFFSLLEHIPDPATFLARVACHLEPKGLLVLEVPSAHEPLVSLYDVAAFKDFYFQAMHPVVFSPKAVESILARAGFGRIELRFKQRYGLANHLQWLRKGVPGGSSEFAALFSDGADRAYVAALEKAGTTDTLYASAEFQG